MSSEFDKKSLRKRGEALIDRLLGMPELFDNDELQVMEDLMQSSDASVKMRKALDLIYNHNEAARAAVILHYGLWHDQPEQAALSAIEPTLIVAAEAALVNLVEENKRHYRDSEWPAVTDLRAALAKAKAASPSHVGQQENKAGAAPSDAGFKASGTSTSRGLPNEPAARPSIASKSRRQIVFDWLMQENGYWGGSEEVAQVDKLLAALDAFAPSTAAPNNANAPTPRTDALEFICGTGKYTGAQVVLARDYAKLERELAESRERCVIWSQKYDSAFRSSTAPKSDGSITVHGYSFPASLAARSPLGGLAEVLAFYDELVNGRLDPLDAEADFVMRGSDWRAIRAAVSASAQQERDAARYRWLRDHADHDSEHDLAREGIDLWRLPEIARTWYKADVIYSTFDAAVDALMASPDGTKADS